MGGEGGGNKFALLFPIAPDLSKKIFVRTGRGGGRRLVPPKYDAVSVYRNHSITPGGFSGTVEGSLYVKLFNFVY